MRRSLHCIAGSSPMSWSRSPCSRAGDALGMRQGLAWPSIVSAVVLLGLNAFGAAYLLFAVHAGFADGLATTLRAAVFAYVLAAFMDWVLPACSASDWAKNAHLAMRSLRNTADAQRGPPALQPKADYVLVGSLQARCDRSGTPESLVDNTYALAAMRARRRRSRRGPSCAAWQKPSAPLSSFKAAPT